MTRRRRALAHFHHPGPDEIDYGALLEAMKACRLEVLRFRSACGLRNPAYDEAEALIEEIDALAALTRVPDAVALVNPPAPVHSAGYSREPTDRQ